MPLLPLLVTETSHDRIQNSGYFLTGDRRCGSTSEPVRQLPRMSHNFSSSACLITILYSMFIPFCMYAVLYHEKVIQQASLEHRHTGNWYQWPSRRR